MINFRILDESWAKQLEASLSEYVDALLSGVDDDTSQTDTETGQVFCGCDVCYWREILAYVTPRIIDGFLNGQVDLDV